MVLQIDDVQMNLDCSFKIIKTYAWLLDSYVLDFFIGDHWQRLPLSWQDCFESLSIKEIGDICSSTQVKKVLPLSFLALLQAINAYSLPRQKIQVENDQNRSESNICSDFHSMSNEKDLKTPQKQILIPEIGLENECHWSNESKSDNSRSNLDMNHESHSANENQEHNTFTCGTHPRLKNLFLKHVKLKKRHEIINMAQIVNETANSLECDAVVDFGSGVGHLVRTLAYKHDIHSIGIEQQKQLTDAAMKLDKELEYTASKHLSQEQISALKRPIHINKSISSNLNDLILPNHVMHYGLIGLHPCGDLGPYLLKHFESNKNVKFICLVGCCYMKLSHKGYPLSGFVKNSSDTNLSFVSKEIACHAIEVYLDRLREEKYEDLKVHAFRATLETLIVEINPQLKHAGVGNISHSKALTFERYCELACQKLCIYISKDLMSSKIVTERLRQWERVVIFYTLRLIIAPLVESVILLDRALALMENGITCQLKPVFDPRLSPRNHILIGMKQS